MNGAELQCSREFLGLSGTWVAEKLGVDRRSVNRWESGEHPVPNYVEQNIKAWLGITQRAVGVASVQLRNQPHRPLSVLREDGDTEWPSEWYRTVAARAVEITGGRITWETP